MPVRLKRWICAGVAALWLLGCDAPKAEERDNSKSPSRVASPVPQVSTGNLQGPMTATLSGPAQPVFGAPLALTLRLDRRQLHDTTDVHVEVDLPEGVSLLQGEVRSVVSPDTRQVTELHYSVEVPALPERDLTITVDAKGEGFGYHAVLPYAFGRAPLLPEAVSRSEGSVRVTERDFGRPVSIDPAR